MRQWLQQLNLKNSYVSGKFAEFIAKCYLGLLGYFVIASRYSVGRGLSAGEVDIIAKRGKTIVFIEVKKRATLPLAMESIFSRQQARIYNSAEVFIAKHPKYASFDCRFDAICFNKYYFFRHIKNAWGF